MLSVQAIRERLLAALPQGTEVHVVDTTGTNDHFEALVVSPAFRGQSMVQQHQQVYAPLQDWLASGELHALALKTYTPEGWQKARGGGGGAPGR